jgi:hypothetical protein
MRVRCVGGPYAGQTFEFPKPRTHRDPDWGRAETGPLVWINNGPDRHCYQLIQRWYQVKVFVLVYRDTF